MTTAKEMKDELRQLRKQNMKPVSRMKVADISAEIQKLKGHREETPAPAAVPSAPLKKSMSSVESIKDAKMHEFPVKPNQGVTAGTKGAKPGKAPKDNVSAAVAEEKASEQKKKSKLARLLEMMDEE
jgi:hypothetical protein